MIMNIDHKIKFWFKIQEKRKEILYKFTLDSEEKSYVVRSISFQTFFVQAFRIVIDTWKYGMLLLYFLWDDWPIFMISASNELLQQELEYTLLKHIVTAGEFQKGNLDVRTL